MLFPYSGPGDILERDLQKTLQLIWVLILQYQIGSSPISPSQHTKATRNQRKQQSKRDMLVWVNAILPGRNITNFTTDWRSGDNLVALLNYCQPGVVDPSATADLPIERISNAIKMAKSALKVPNIITSEDLVTHTPDEPSVMTYLSYFCRPHSPGEKKLLAWIQQQIPDENITNTNLISGVFLGALVDSLSGNSFSQHKKMNPANRVENSETSLKQAQLLLNIPFSFSAEEFSNVDFNHLTRLAYLSQFHAAKHGEPVVLTADASKVKVSPVLVCEEKEGKFVHVEVDCCESGLADIQAKASTKGGNSVAVSVSETEPDKYLIKFQAKETIYSLKVTYGNEEVSGSPFYINLASADASKVVHKATDVSKDEKQLVSVSFDTTEAGYGRLSAEATGECAGCVALELVRKPNGMYEVLFTPPFPDVYSVDVKWGEFYALAQGKNCGTVPIEFQKTPQKEVLLSFEPPTPDIYTVNVSWGGKPVPGSPFIINLLPQACPEKVEVADPIFSSPGENVDLLLDTTNAGSGELTATCKGDKVGNVDTIITPITKKAHQVGFIPPELDVYNLSVFFNGTPVQGSPFCINLLHPQQSKQVPQPKYTKEIGTSMVIKVKGDKKSKVTASCYGDATGPCAAVIKRDQENNFKVTINPKSPDIYFLDIQLNNNPIPNSPFIINYVPRITPDHTKVKVIDIDLKEQYEKLSDIDSPFTFAIDARETGKGKPEVKVEAPDHKHYEVDLKEREDENHVFDVSYTPKVTGTHYLNTLWDGKPIPDSPVVVRAVNFEKLQNFPHGKNVAVDVDIPSDAKEKDLKVRVYHPVIGTLSKVSARHSKGKYRIGFTPKLPGLYSIHVLYKDKEIPPSPFVVRYGDPPRPDLCVVKDVPQYAVVDQKMEFTVDCTKGGSGELNVKTSNRYLLKRDKSKLSWRETSEGVFTVSYIPAITGDHTFVINWAGRPVKGTPLSVPVIEKPPEVVPPTAQLYLIDLLKRGIQKKKERIDPIPETVLCTVGNALLLSVTVSGKDLGLLATIGRTLTGQSLKEVTATAVGGKTGKVDITVKNTHGGTYDVLFCPEEPDLYTITVQHEDVDIVSTPFKAQFTRAPTDPTKVEIVEMKEWDQPIQCFLDQDFKFHINGTQAGPGKFKVKAEAPGTEEPLVNIAEDDKYSYGVKYVPKTAGTHKINMFWDEDEIPSSPLTLNVKEPAAIQLDQPGVFEIPPGKWKLSDIKATGLHLDSSTPYEVKKSQKKGKYKFSLQPRQPGTYEIQLKVGGHDIVRPFRFKYDRPSLPENVVIYDLQRETGVNETIKFMADVSEAGVGTLKVNARGPGKSRVKAVDNKDGTYSIKFSAKKSGTYNLDVTWAGEEIPSSPLEIEVLDPVAVMKEEQSMSYPDYAMPPQRILEDDLHSYMADTLGNFGRERSSSNLTTDSPPVSEVAMVEEADVLHASIPSVATRTIGRMASWDIDTSEHEGDLEVRATGEKTGEVDIQLTKVRDDMYQVIFNPTEPDCYTISITANGKHLPNSPMTIIYTPLEPNQQNVKIIGKEKIPPLVTVGQPVRVIVDTRDGGTGELTVKPTLPSSKKKSYTLDVTNFNDDPRMIDLNYTPLVVGEHSFDLLWAGKQIPDSPIEVKVCEPHLVMNDVVSSSLKSKPDEPIKICFDSSKAGCGELTATCSGNTCGEVPVSLTKAKGKSKYDVSFKPEVEDLYTLEVKLGPYHVSGSPFHINLTKIHMENVISSGITRPEGPEGPVQLALNTSAIPVRGKLVSSCKYHKKKEVGVTVKETAPNEYLLQFQPPEAAEYIWSVTYHDQHIPGSPFLIDLRSHPENIKVIAPEIGYIGQTLNYQVDVTEAGIGKLTATCKGKKSKKVRVDLEPVSPGVYDVSYLPLNFDLYSLYIQWSGKEVPDSPFQFEFKPPTADEVARMDVNLPLSLPPMTGTNDVEISCTGEKCGTIPTKLISVSSKKYRIGFKPQGPDLYTLTVMHDGHHVKDSPYYIDLRVPETSEQDEDVVLKLGSPRQHVNKEIERFVGTPLNLQFHAQTPEQRNGKAVVTAVGAKTGSADVDVQQISSDFYDLTFNPKEPDTYTINASLNAIPVPSTPLIVHYKKAPSKPSKVRIIGLKEIPSHPVVDDKVCLVVDATQGGTGVLQAKVKGPDDKHHKPTLDLQPREDDPGLYDVMLVPHVKGKYRLSLLWDNKDIPHSPVKLQVIDPKTTLKFEPGKDAVTDEVEIVCNPADLSAYALKENSTAKLKVKAKQTKKNRYKFVFSCKQPGFYYIHALVGDEELPFSPIPVYISQPPQPKKCKVIKKPPVGFVNRELPLTVDCTQGGDGSLEAKVIGPNDLDNPLDILDNGDKTYDVSYTPTTVGDHYFHFTWSGRPIYKSPCKVKVKELMPDELPVSEVCFVDCGEGLHALPPDPDQEEVVANTDEEFTFSVPLTDEQESKFKPKAIDEKGNSIDFDRVKKKNGHYKFSFKPPSPGWFTFDFNLGGLKLRLPHFPKRIKYKEPDVDAKKVKVLKKNIPGLLLVDKPISFQLDTRRAGNSTLYSQLEGPSIDNSALHIKPTISRPHFYDVMFTPKESGLHKLDLFWGGDAIPGSPFKFDVKDKKVKFGDDFSRDIAVKAKATDIRSHVIHVESGQKKKVRLTQVSKDRYKFFFRPKKPGNYNLYVFADKEEIEGSPFPFYYSRPAEPWNVTVSGLKKQTKVNSPVKFTINAKKAGDGDLKVKVLPPQESECPKVFLKEKQDNVFAAEFTPQVPGEYGIEVTWSGEDVPDSPFKVDAKDRDIKQRGVSGVGMDIDKWMEDEAVVEPTSVQYAGMPMFTEMPEPEISETDLHLFQEPLNLGKVRFDVIHGGHPGSLEMTSKGPKKLSLNTINEGNHANTYEITPELPGKYPLEFHWNDHKITGGPYSLFFRKPRTITGFDIEGQNFQVGKSYQFTIQADKISRGIFEITCEPSNAASVSITAIPGSNDYMCSITPRSVGSFAINACHNGCHIQGSPFNVNFKEAAASSLNFHLKANGIETGDISATLESKDTQQMVPMSLNQLFGGECNMEFMPTEGDEYVLTITCHLKVKKETVPGSPFNLSYLPLKTDASMCKFEIPDLSNLTLGEWLSFVVDCEEAGPGNLTAIMEGAEVKVVPITEYKYEVEFCIATKGHYELALQWGGQEVPGSPFGFDVQETIN